MQIKTSIQDVIAKELLAPDIFGQFDYKILGLVAAVFGLLLAKVSSLVFFTHRFPVVIRVVVCRCELFR